MIPVSQVIEIGSGLVYWSAYSREHKVELTASAALTPTGWWIFDPILLVEEGFSVFNDAPVRAIVLTNGNHQRAALHWRARWAVEVWAAPDASLELPGVRRWRCDARQLDEWQIIPLPGGPSGETALFWPDHSLMVFGDAVVNLAGQSLEILPSKYCRDGPLLRKSLRGLPDFELAVFAHGRPLRGKASVQIAELQKDHPSG